MYESISVRMTGDNIPLKSTYFLPLNVYENSEIALLCLQTPYIKPRKKYCVIIDETNNKIGFLRYIKGTTLAIDEQIMVVIRLRILIALLKMQLGNMN
jgi:hypothetical protein